MICIARRVGIWLSLASTIGRAQWLVIIGCEIEDASFFFYVKVLGYVWSVGVIASSTEQNNFAVVEQ